MDREQGRKKGVLPLVSGFPSFWTPLSLHKSHNRARAAGVDSISLSSSNATAQLSPCCGPM